MPTVIAIMGILSHIFLFIKDAEFVALADTYSRIPHDLSG